MSAAVSGGSDSVALLLLLLELRSELGIVLSVAHVNHKLRGDESDADEQFVAELARKHGLQSRVCTAPVAQASGIEAAARRLRYDFFRSLIREGQASTIATAHTIDDQAETVLLRILRGTGIRGLAGIHLRLPMNAGTNAQGEVVRPLLRFPRAELESYLRAGGYSWREDSSNHDLTFLRNRVRHRVLPLMKEHFGAATIENLADLAEIARAEEQHWGSHPEVFATPETLHVDSLLALPLAAQRRLARAWLEQRVPAASVSFRLIENILGLASGTTEQKMKLPAGYMARRSRRGLCLEPDEAETAARYEYALPIPGQVEIAELGTRIEAKRARLQELAGVHRAQLLDPERLPRTLVVRNWRAGDRFWPAHTKEPAKVKELLSDRHVTGVEKKLWPVIEADGLGLIWMRGFPAPDALRPVPDAGEVLCIEEQSLTDVEP